MSKKVKISKEMQAIVMKTELNNQQFAQMKELSTKKGETKIKYNTTQEQTSGNKGFRIIGVIKDITQDSKPVVGYILYNDLKQEHCTYSVKQVLNILGMHKLVNAIAENGAVKITDGAESALLQFNNYMIPIGENTVYVLSRATEKFIAKGKEQLQDVVTIINNRLEVQKLLVSTLIEAKQAGKINIANMKVVTDANNNTAYLAAKNVDTVPTYQKEIKPQKVATDEAEAFRKLQLKLRNHASFAQRLYNVINDCVLIQNSPNESRYTSCVRLRGTSELDRGLSIVGTKGLKAIIENEVIPLFKQHNPSLDFTAALKEVNTTSYPDGEYVAIQPNFFVKSGSWSKNDTLRHFENPIQQLFYRYLWAFRQVKGLYKVINTYEILQTYNERYNVSKLPYIVGKRCRVAKVIDDLYTTKEDKLIGKPASHLFYSVSPKFDIDNKLLPEIICNGVTTINSHVVIWPMPFANMDRAYYIMNKLIGAAQLCKPMILHICSEASLIRASLPHEEYQYRVDRFNCMSVALMTHLALTLSKADYNETLNLIKSLIEEAMNGECRELLDSFIFKTGLGLYHTIQESSKINVSTYVKDLLDSYIQGAGLFVPYYSSLGVHARDDYMHWECILQLFKNHASVTNMNKKFKVTNIEDRTTSGLLNVLNLVFTTGTTYIKLNYPISTASRHYDTLKRECRNHNSEIINTLSKASIAQYLGRPYRIKSPKGDPRLLRLVLYVRTPAIENATHTHGLY